MMLRFVIFAVLAFGTISAHAEALKVCLLASSPPYSDQQNNAGFDHDVGQLVAARIGRTFEAVWIKNDANIVEIDESDFPLHRLEHGGCDLLLSVPGPGTDTLSGHEGLALGPAYYGAAFQLMSCGAEVQSTFRGLRGRSVAIQSQTIAHFALVMVKAKPLNFFSIEDAYRAVADGEADAGLLWGPAIGSRLKSEGSAAQCQLVPDYEPPAAVRWNLHPAYRSDATALSARIMSALEALEQDGSLAAVMRRYGIPDHRPFATTYGLRAINELERPPR